jgi:ABC-2 type transport system permease protein
LYAKTDSIAAIWNLHHEILKRSSQGNALELANANNTRQERICLVYNLKDGSHIYRQYNVPAREYAEQLKPIYETREYKDAHYPILGINPTVIKMIDINAAADVNKNVRISNPLLIEQAVKALQADVIAQTYEEMTRELPAWADITILVDQPDKANKIGQVSMSDQNLHLRWEKSYLNFEKWLKDNKEYNNARVIASEDLKCAVVARRVNNSKEDIEAVARMEKEATQQIIADLEENPENLKISNPDQLETCLHNYGYSYKQSNESKEIIYDIFFFLKNGRSFSGSFNVDSAPSFVKEHFGR